ncbi:MAG: CBS domain-containing protein [Actinomycetota bacterium]
MSQLVKDVMTPDPITIDAKAPIAEAAQKMREADVGPLIVMKDGEVCGVVTDRDITIRAVAEGKDPNSFPVGEICSKEVATVSPRDKVGMAIDLMEKIAVRRLPVVDNHQPVGILSLGDLAVERDPESTLAQISAAPPNE